MEILKCNNLSASYEGDAVLGSLSFTVNEGDYLCILGENGSGKSTLVKCLLGIKKADSGSIILGSGLKHSDIGYLPQHTEMKNGFPATVREVVLSGCLAHRGIRPFYSSKEKRLPPKLWNVWEFPSLPTRAAVSFQAVSSSGCFLPVLCAQLKNCCFWTNLLQVSTRLQLPKCTVL